MSTSQDPAPNSPEIPDSSPTCKQDLQLPQPITEEWLKASGFKWHQLDRQPSKHWTLWLDRCFGNCAGDELGIEIAAGAYNRRTGQMDEWFCWLRSDIAGRYSRFIHVRHLTLQQEVIQLVEAITAKPWNPDHHIYGMVHTEKEAARIHTEHQRLDVQFCLGEPNYRKHSDIERDDTLSRPLPEHLEAYQTKSLA